MTPMRPTSRRQATLDAWLLRAADEGVIDLASLRGAMRAPTNLLQQLAEAVLDSDIAVMPEGGLPELRRNWAAFEAQSRNRKIDDTSGMVVVNDPLAACAAVVLGLVSPGRHVMVLEPSPPQVVDVVRRVGGMARTVSMRPTEWEFDASGFALRISPQTDLIVLADPNPLSGQYLPDDARQAIVDAAEQMDCVVLVDESARHSVVEGDAPEMATFFSALGARCVRVDVPAAAVLAQAATAAGITGHADLIAPIRSAASAFGLHASVTAQSVLARRFADGAAIDDAATLNGMIASGRALLLDGLDDVGVLGLGGPGGWYVPVRAKALYDGPHDIGDALTSQAGIAALPLAPFYVEGAEDPYVLFAYLRDGHLLENSLRRLGAFSDSEKRGPVSLALPAPEDLDDEEDIEVDEDDDFDAPSATSIPGPVILDVEVDEETEDDVPSEPELEPDVEDEDAQFRAAIAQLSQALAKERSEKGQTSAIDERSTDTENAAPTANEEEAQTVVLPFSRRQREARLPSEGQTDSAPQGDFDATIQEASVFKLSVPDIASPDIRAPEPAGAPAEAEPSSADMGEGNDIPDSAEPDTSAEPSQEASPDRSGQDAEDENAKRVKREDRPFFFDDPMI